MWHAMAVHGYWVQDISDNSVEKSKVELTSGETWRCNFVGGAEWKQVERGGWAAVERIFMSLKRSSHERKLLILFPATTSLEAISVIWLSCSCLGQVAVFPSCMLRWKKYFSLNSPYMTGKRKNCSRYNYFSFSSSFSFHLSARPFQFYFTFLSVFFLHDLN